MDVELGGGVLLQFGQAHLQPVDLPGVAAGFPEEAADVYGQGVGGADHARQMGGRVCPLVFDLVRVVGLHVPLRHLVDGYPGSRQCG